MIGKEFCSVVEPMAIGEAGAWDRDKLELMQYTGLKDKNGKEIYEGDIIKATGHNTRAVEFNSGYFGYKDQFNEWSILTDAMHPNRMDYWEVIGNIYENPELLKTER